MIFIYFFYVKVNNLENAVYKELESEKQTVLGKTVAMKQQFKLIHNTTEKLDIVLQTGHNSSARLTSVLKRKQVY